MVTRTRYNVTLCCIASLVKLYYPLITCVSSVNFGMGYLVSCSELGAQVQTSVQPSCFDVSTFMYIILWVL